MRIGLGLSAPGIAVRARLPIIVPPPATIMVPFGPQYYSHPAEGWFDLSYPESLTVIDDATLTSMKNMGTLGGSATAKNLNAAPTYRSTGGVATDKPGVTWAGGKSPLMTSVFRDISTAALTVIGVIKTGTGFGFINGSENGTRFETFQDDNGTFGYDFNGSDRRTGLGAQNTFTVFALVYNNGTVTPYVNSKAGGTSTYPAFTLPTLGFGTYAGGTGNAFSGQFARYEIIAAAMTTDELYKAMSAAAWRYMNSGASQDAVNPYRDAKPMIEIAAPAQSKFFGSTTATWGTANPTFGATT